MQAKLQKAKLISMHSNATDPEISQLQSEENSIIHTYLTILKHIIKRNKQGIRKLSDSNPKNVLRRDPRNQNQKYEGRKLHHFVAAQTETWKGIRLSGPINEKSRKNCKQFPQLGNFTKSQSKSDSSNIKGGRVNTLQEERRKFTPIGKIYNELKLRTQAASQPSLKIGSNSCIRLEATRGEYHQKFSIFRKPVKSNFRNCLRPQNRQSFQEEYQSRQCSRKDFLQIYRARRADNSSTTSNLPTPW